MMGRPDVEELGRLIKQAQDGDLSAYDQIVRRFQDRAVGYGYSILGDFHRAQDAAQEAFIQAFLDLHTLQEPLAFAGWLGRMVLKYCDRFTRRKQVPTVPLKTLEPVQSRAADPAEAAEQAEMQRCVQAAIADLPALAGGDCGVSRTPGQHRQEASPGGEAAAERKDASHARRRTPESGSFPK
jgi:DNA-directed RNA polymerase specialized sigma24 family protein